MKKYLTIFILIFLTMPYIYGATTFDIQLVVVTNDGTHFGVAVQVKGNDLASAPSTTLNSATIDVTYDNSLLTYVNAGNLAFGSVEGYTNSATNNTTKITIQMLATGVGPATLDNKPGYDVTSSYTTWIQLNFTHSSPSSTTNMNIDPVSAAISLFNHEGDSDGSGTNTSYTVSNGGLTLHGLSNQPLPVELSSFSALVNSNNVNLNWKTATEMNNNGFEVQREVRSQKSETGIQWEKVGFIPGHGNSNSPKEYSFTDNNLTGGTNFVYRLKQIDNDGQYQYSKELEVEVVPKQFSLYQNYPNPFNPSTNIKFDLPEASKVRIDVYNILGEKIAELLNKTIETGFHQVEFNGSNLSSGTYIYRIEAFSSGQNFVQTKKMLLLK